jgi:hypothetical protein
MLEPVRTAANDIFRVPPATERAKLALQERAQSDFRERRLMMAINVRRRVGHPTGSSKKAYDTSPISKLNGILGSFSASRDLSGSAGSYTCVGMLTNAAVVLPTFCTP